MTDDIAQHYANAGIAERILAAAREIVGPSGAITPDVLAPADQLHGRGLAATQDLAAMLAAEAGERVLDIGSGVGGPARWIAAHYGCHVTGIDLTAEFCEAARALNAATGLADRVAIVHGSALALPFADVSFDRAYSHNVIMNIADKPAFYREAWRVLKPGGVLALMNLIAGPDGSVVHYPTPWAASAATSFLATLEETRAHIADQGFQVLALEDTTDKTRASRRTRSESFAADTPPVLGTHLIMGPRVADYQRNSLRNDDAGSVRSIAALLRRPE